MHSFHQSLESQNGSTAPGFTLFIVIVVVIIAGLDFSYQHYGAGIPVATSFLILIGFGGLGVVIWFFRSWRAKRHRRYLKEQYGIEFEPTIPEDIRERLRHCDILDSHELAFQLDTYLLETSGARCGVFLHIWSTGFGDGRREDQGLGFYALAKNDDVSLSGVLFPLFESSSNIETICEDRFFVAYTRDLRHPTLQPEKILPAARASFG